MATAAAGFAQVEAAGAERSGVGRGARKMAAASVFSVRAGVDWLGWREGEVQNYFLAPNVLGITKPG